MDWSTLSYNVRIDLKIQDDLKLFLETVQNRVWSIKHVKVETNAVAKNAPFSYK